MSLGAEEVGPGYFAVTVTAEVLAAEQASDGPPMWVPVGTRFYSVGVVETSARFAVTSLPTLMTAPAKEPVLELLIRRLDGLDSAPGLEALTLEQGHRPIHHRGSRDSLQRRPIEVMRCSDRRPRLPEAIRNTRAA